MTELFYVRRGPSLCSAAVIRNMAFETVAFRREILTFKGIETMVKVDTVDLITGVASFRNYWVVLSAIISGGWNRGTPLYRGVWGLE